MIYTMEQPESPPRTRTPVRTWTEGVPDPNDAGGLRAVSVAEQVEQVLAQAKAPMSAEDICHAMFRVWGLRERQAVHLVLHRLDERGKLIKRPKAYELRK